MFLSTRHFQQLFSIFIILANIVIKISLGSLQSHADISAVLERHHRVKRGNYGERYSGGLGAQGAYGGGGYHTPVRGPNLIFDHIALQAVSGGNTNFVNSYQAQINAQASQAGSLMHAAQNGQHAAAHAGIYANQVGQLYNSIATGPVSPTYKGEYRRRR